MEIDEGKMADLGAVAATPLEVKVTKLKNSCSGKKGSITRRIDELNRLVSESGSRTRIKFLHEAMLEVYRALKVSFNKLSELVDTPEYDWLESIDASVGVCTAEVSEYIESRRDDPSSTSSLTDSWVKKHSPRITYDDTPKPLLSEDGSEVYDTELLDLLNRQSPPVDEASTLPSQNRHAFNAEISNTFSELNVGDLASATTRPHVRFSTMPNSLDTHARNEVWRTPLQDNQESPARPAPSQYQLYPSIWDVNASQGNMLKVPSFVYLQGFLLIKTPFS